MTESEIIDLCRDVERLVFRDDLTANTPRRFDLDPAAYETLKQRLREMNMEYEIGWDHILGQHFIKIYRLESSIERTSVSEPLAFMQASTAVLKGD